jgi:hypothetical protein
MNNISKFAQARAMRDKATLNYIKESNAEAEAAKAKAQKDKDDAIARDLAENMTSPAHRRKELYENAQRIINYRDHFRMVGLTEALTKIAVDALPLDKTEYAKVNPTYVTEMKNMIKGFLESDKANKTFDNKNTLAIVEALDSNMPDANTHLNEDDEIKAADGIVMNNVPAQLDSLTHNVENSVATIAANDQAVAQAQQVAIDSAKDAEQSVADLAAADQQADATMNPAAPIAPVSPVVDQPVVSPLEDPDSPLPDVQDQTIDAEKNPVPQPRDDKSVPGLVVAKEQFAKGILESFAVSEGRKLITEGKAYDADLALANAVKIITVLETVDKTGIVNIGEAGYRQIISNLGIGRNPTKTISEDTVNKLNAAINEACKSKKAVEPTITKQDDVKTVKKVVSEEINMDSIREGVEMALARTPKFEKLPRNFNLIDDWNKNHPDQKI